MSIKQLDKLIFDKKKLRQEKSKLFYKSRKLLDEGDISMLKEGLMKKLMFLKKEYGDMSHKTIFDTLVTKRK